MRAGVIGLQLQGGTYPAGRVVGRPVLQQNGPDLVPQLGVVGSLQRFAKEAIHTAELLARLDHEIQVRLGFVGAPERGQRSPQRIAGQRVIRPLGDHRFEIRERLRGLSLGELELSPQTTGLVVIRRSLQRLLQPLRDLGKIAALVGGAR